MESQTVQKKEPRLSPVVKLQGMEYLIDIEPRKFQEFKNSDNVIKMHSDKGRQIFNEIAGGQWDSFGVDSYPRKGVKV
jgi:hypothetical protein